VDVELSMPGIVRAVVRRGEDATRVDWAHDSAWRFMPLVREELGGVLLHPVDLAINKVLALAGRDEPRDFVDTLFVHHRVLPLGALCWAAAGKDPGFTPRSLLELPRRRGRYRPEDFSRLHLTELFDLVRGQETWLGALAHAEAFVRGRPGDRSALRRSRRGAAENGGLPQSSSQRPGHSGGALARQRRSGSVTNLRPQRPARSALDLPTPPPGYSDRLEGSSCPRRRVAH
jgi:hypothetical protein